VLRCDAVKTLTKPRVVIAGAAALLVGLGAAGAIAATKALSPSDASKAVIDDAAGQLGVTPAALSGALEKALENRVDAAVAAGQLTKEQGAALKQRIESGDFPLVWPGALGGPRPGGFGFGHAGHGGGLAVAASYLGMSEQDLATQLSSGKTLAQVATANGKSVSGLVDAMVAAAQKRLDQAVADGKLTKEQAAKVESDLRDHVTAFVNGEGGDHWAGHPDQDGGHQRFMPWHGSAPAAPPASYLAPNL
jgi:polyhydroxyalkanoate synthesis regulator phasin